MLVYVHCSVFFGAVNSSSEVLDYYISWDKNILVSFPNCSCIAGKNWFVNESIRFQAWQQSCDSCHLPLGQCVCLKMKIKEWRQLLPNITQSQPIYADQGVSKVVDTPPSDGFKGFKCTPLWRLVMYLCVHAVTTTRHSYTHVSVPYTDLQKFVQVQSCFEIFSSNFRLFFH